MANLRFTGWVQILFIYLLLEVPYLFLLGAVHERQLLRMTNASSRRRLYFPAIGLFYALAPFVFYYFAIEPSNSVRTAALRGAILGAAMYGTYDITLLAILGPELVSIPYAAMDLAWGATVVSIVSAAAAYLGGSPW